MSVDIRKYLALDAVRSPSRVLSPVCACFARSGHLYELHSHGLPWTGYK